VEQRLAAYQHGAEKHQLYLNHYERHFQQFVEHHINLLELGIYRGGSLLQWRDFFRNGQIIGLDLDPVSIDDPTGRVVTYQGDQADLALLDRIARERAPGGFDIIIDDASHIAALTKISFWHLFDNHLKPGGYYVIEDWRVSYSDAAPDGARYEWPAPTPVGSPQAESPDHTGSSPGQVDQMARRIKRMLDGLGGPGLTRVAARLYRRQKYKSRRFPSHDYGMVGLVKQLIDELGMDAITNPQRGGPPPQRFPKFQRMEVCPGQVFIVKATEQDNELIAESLRHPFPAVSASEPSDDHRPDRLLKVG
jgi:hypothetical protein